jgi:hypothetical protein
LGLDGQVELLNGGGGRGAALRKKNKGAGTVRHWRRSPEEKHVEEEDGEDEIRWGHQSGRS